ncbi:MAG: hypothetical protein H7Z76_10935 [Methylotenera sp.]|nr:hypothetical protein [Flavobacterium sp.]
METNPEKPEFTLEMMKQHLDDLTNQIESDTPLDKWKELRMTNESHYPIPEPMIAINGESIATAGNLVVISGIQKSAKTSISMIFLACFIRAFLQPVDGVPSQIMGQPAGTKANLHFDTEQAKHKYFSNIKAMLRRLGKTDIPKNLYAYSLRGQSIEDSLAIIENTFVLAEKECGGIHSCFIDGIADLVNSVNDELESNKIIKFFEDLATNYNCLVVAVIHRNPNDSKVRGHLGSQLLRKAEAILCVKKENDFSYIEPEDLRTASNGDIPKLIFQYQKEKGYHVCIGESSTIEPTTKIEMYENLLDMIFSETETLRYSDLANQIAKFTSKSAESAKKYIREMQSFDMIFCPKKGQYQRQIIEEN